MLAAPARIAMAPRASSRVSWKPAVPPPPVTGAAVGNGLGDGLAVGLGDGVGEGVGDVRVRDGLGDGLGEAEALALGEALGESVGVAEVPTAGEDVGSAPEDVDDVQAVMVTEARMVKMPQPRAASLTRSPVPAGVVRSFMEPPHASGR
jgi:hypothetical protein